MTALPAGLQHADAVLDDGGRIPLGGGAASAGGDEFHKELRQSWKEGLNKTEAYRRICRGWGDFTPQPQKLILC